MRILGFIFWIYWMTVYNIITFSSAAIVLLLSMFMSMKSGSFLRKLVTIWSRLGFILAFSPVEVRGKENMLNEPSVIIANHQANLDVLLLAGYLPKDFLFVSKKEIFYLPFVGQLMKKMGYVSVDRKNLKRAASSIRHAIARIKENNRILIFPEGTRSKDPENLLPFKPGSLMIARQGKVPILPVIIYGTSKIHPRNKPFYMIPRRSVIQILKAIHPEDDLHPSKAKSVIEEDEILDKLRNKMNLVYRELANEMESKK
ncbi:MAG: 1-acyl-sn-glycerol-3-phosphate acyltransferase [Spirochaetia bacterium]|nr:1-acyl-sn-glycerol-3-phosphate acyltransferase [Spirochaetia bacterium]